MTAAEYQEIQRRLSALLARDRMRLRQLSGKRAEGYEEAVLAAKSVLSGFNPEKRDKRL